MYECDYEKDEIWEGVGISLEETIRVTQLEL